MPLDCDILIYGTDATLLDTRRWVLESAGFRVITVSGLAAADQAISRESIGLLVLCHTLTSEERRAALAIAERHPQMKKLSMWSVRQQVGTEVISGATLNSFAGAEGLISAAWKLLQ